MGTIGNCRLCGAEHIHLCRSHIFPEFLYRPVYDPANHSFHVYSSNRQWRPSPRYQGIYEPLLCRDCEVSFGELETYACQAFFNGLKSTPGLTQECFIVADIDYRKFKLFLLSLIWRAGVTSRPEFVNVRLGQHEQSIRKMLLRRSPGDPLDYPVVVFAMKNGLKSVISLPEAFKPIHGLQGYRTVMAGLTWMFALGKHRSSPVLPYVLDKEGNLPLIKDNGMGMAFLSHRAVHS